MKKIIVFLLTALLMFSVAFADSVPMSKADQMASLVKNFLEENEFPYEYDDYTFTVPFSVDNSMEYAFITVYIYDDMLSVSVHVDLFLAQFRINKLLSGIKAEIARKQEAYKRRDHAEQCAFAAEELYAEQDCRNGAVRHTAEHSGHPGGCT